MTLPPSPANMPPCHCAQHQPYSAWMSYRMTIYCFKIMPPVARAPGIILGTTKQNCAVMQGVIIEKLLPWIIYGDINFLGLKLSLSVRALWEWLFLFVGSRRRGHQNWPPGSGENFTKGINVTTKLTCNKELITQHKQGSFTSVSNGSDTLAQHVLASAHFLIRCHVYFLIRA